METPLTDKLYKAKGTLAHVTAHYPAGADGALWLEEAIELIGRAADEVEAVEDPDFAYQTVSET